MSLAAPGQLNLHDAVSWGSRTSECYEKLDLVGEGTYGQVFKAKDKETGEIVALKKIRMDNEKEGFPITAIREIKILKKLKHENVVHLKEIVTSKGVDATKTKGNIYMVFEYMDHDLTGLADRPNFRFSIPQIKCYMQQILHGLHYCHINHVLHRDIKGSNLLINNEGILKLADFGLARAHSGESNGQLTNRVITLWYRPPELLLGSTKYGPAVDMWSVGCIFAELISGKPLFPGKNEAEQLSQIFNICGSPEESNWPGVSTLPHYQQFKRDRPFKRRLREHLKVFDKHALDLLERMLTLDPSKRITAQEALDSEYFWSDPLPADKASLPKYESSHEYDVKRKRQQQSKEDASKKPRPGMGPQGGPQANQHYNRGPGQQAMPPPRGGYAGNGGNYRQPGGGQGYANPGRGNGYAPPGISGYGGAPWGGGAGAGGYRNGGYRGGGVGQNSYGGAEEAGGYVDIDAPGGHGGIPKGR